MSYSKPIYITYRALANASVSTAATALSFIGPVGRKGRVVHVGVIITTEMTGAAAGITIHPNGGTGGSCLIMSVPLGVAGVGHVATLAELAAGADLTADAVHDVVGDGAATLGEADIAVTVAWF